MAYRKHNRDRVIEVYIEETKRKFHESGEVVLANSGGNPIELEIALKAHPIEVWTEFTDHEDGIQVCAGGLDYISVVLKPKSFVIVGEIKSASRKVCWYAIEKLEEVVVIVETPPPFHNPREEEPRKGKGKW